MKEFLNQFTKDELIKYIEYHHNRYSKTELLNYIYNLRYKEIENKINNNLNNANEELAKNIDELAKEFNKTKDIRILEEREKLINKIQFNLNEFIICNEEIEILRNWKDKEINKLQ